MYFKKNIEKMDYLTIFNKVILILVVVCFFVVMILNYITEKTMYTDKGIIKLDNSFIEYDQGFGEGKIYPTDTSLTQYGAKIYGSWMNTDATNGKFVSGWYKSRGTISFMVYGTPYGNGNELYIETKTKKGNISRINCTKEGHFIQGFMWNVNLGAEEKSFRITASDASDKMEGWLGVSEPLKSTIPNFKSIINIMSIPAAFVYILLFLVPGFLLAFLLVSRQIVDEKWLLILSITIASLISYIIFWIYFFNHLFGRYFSCLFILTCLIIFFLKFKTFEKIIFEHRFIAPIVLTLLTACFYLSALYIYSPSDGITEWVANNRFVKGLPADNIIPKLFLERIYNGLSFENFLGDWLASDRPPLATAILTTVRPLSIFNEVMFYQYVGTYLELLWIPGLFSICIFYELDKKVIGLILSSAIFSGVYLINSVFLWPKLLTIPLFSLTYILVFNLCQISRIEIRHYIQSVLIGVAAALSLLSHGGIIFSCIALGIAIMINKHKLHYKFIMTAFASFLCTYIPWILFQKFVDPPGNRLFKWHLAGVIEVNNLSFTEAFIKAYTQTPIKDIIQNKIENIKALFPYTMINWFGIPVIGTEHIRTFGSPLVLNLFLLSLMIHMIDKYCLKKEPLSYQAKITIYFTFLSFFVWPMLMFEPAVTTIHQGSHFNLIIIYLFIAIGAKYTTKIIANIIFVFNIIMFFALFVANTDLTFVSMINNINLEMALFMIVLFIFVIFYNCVSFKYPFTLRLFNRNKKGA